MPGAREGDESSVENQRGDFAPLHWQAHLTGILVHAGPDETVLALVGRF